MCHNCWADPTKKKTKNKKTIVCDNCKGNRVECGPAIRQSIPYKEIKQKLCQKCWADRTKKKTKTKNIKKIVCEQCKGNRVECDLRLQTKAYKENNQKLCR